MIEKEPLKHKSPEAHLYDAGKRNTLNKGFGRVAIIEGPERLKSRECILEDAFVGYAEYNLFKGGDDNFKSFRQYIDRNDVKKLCDMEVEEGVPQKTKNDILIQIYNETDYRRRNGTPPINYCYGEQFNDFKAVLKIEYAMNFNNVIKDIITKQRENQNLTLLDVKIKLYEVFTNISSKKENNIYRGYDFYHRYSNLSKIIEGMMGSLEGMRHEAGFVEMYSDVDCFDIKPSYSRKEDLKGVDMRLDVKLSHILNKNGEYRIANASEIRDGNYLIKELPVDIKSTERGAAKARKDDCIRNGKVDHWAIWSQIDKFDFCFGTVASGDRLGLMFSKNDLDQTVIYLEKRQVDAMKRFCGTKVDLRCYENNQEEVSFRIGSYQEKLNSLKSDIISGINAMYTPETFQGIPLAKIAK